MYSLVQVGIITIMELKEHLYPFGYAPDLIKPVLWKYKDSVA